MKKKTKKKKKKKKIGGSKTRWRPGGDFVAPGKNLKIEENSV
jgi:hypothetical protein